MKFKVGDKVKIIGPPTDNWNGVMINAVGTTRIIREVFDRNDPDPYGIVIDGDMWYFEQHALQLKEEATEFKVGDIVVIENFKGPLHDTIGSEMRSFLDTEHKIINIKFDVYRSDDVGFYLEGIGNENWAFHEYNLSLANGFNPKRIIQKAFSIPD